MLDGIDLGFLVLFLVLWGVEELIKVIALRLLNEEHERKLKVARGEKWQTVGRKGRKSGCWWKSGGSVVELW